MFTQKIATIIDCFFFCLFFNTAVEVMLNVSLLPCVLSAETDFLQTLDNNHNSQQHQQQYNLFPSLDQDRYTRRGGAKQGNNVGYSLVHCESTPIQTTHLWIRL